MNDVDRPESIALELQKAFTTLESYMESRDLKSLSFVNDDRGTVRIDRLYFDQKTEEIKYE